MKPRNVLVTGGCGFIGTNFIKHIIKLYPDWKIINVDSLTYAATPLYIDNENYEHIIGDICDIKLMKHIFKYRDIDTVVHLAAESHVDRSISNPFAFIQTNIVGTHTLLECAKDAWGVRHSDDNHPLFLHVSTDEVYGSLSETDGPFTERTAYSPRSPYSASKASSDHIAKSYFYTYGLPVIVTNCSNNYGPHQDDEKLIPKTITNILHGRTIPIYGDGKNVRDWLHVSDHCNALVKVIEDGVYGYSYNIGGNNEYRNIDIVNYICEIMDSEVKPLILSKNLIKFIPDRLGHDLRYSVDATLISRGLKWEPCVPFETGIRNTIAWYIENEIN